MMGMFSLSLRLCFRKQYSIVHDEWQFKGDILAQPHKTGTDTGKQSASRFACRYLFLFCAAVPFYWLKRSARSPKNGIFVFLPRNAWSIRKSQLRTKMKPTAKK